MTEPTPKPVASSSSSSLFSLPSATTAASLAPSPVAPPTPVGSTTSPASSPPIAPPVPTTPSPSSSSSTAPLNSRPLSSAPLPNPSFAPVRASPRRYQPIPRVPPRSYPAAVAVPSPIPRFLRTLAFLVALLLGSGAALTFIYSRLLLPRIVRTREARRVLIEDQLHRLKRVQEEVDRLLGVGLIRLPKKSKADGVEGEGEEKESTESTALVMRLASSATTTSTTDGEKKPDDDELAIALKGDGKTGAVDLLPTDPLQELAALLPSLAPQPRPFTLNRTLRDLSAHTTTQSLLFNSKTPRGSGGAYAFSKIEETGGAWGGGLSEGDRDVLSLIGGLRGDVRGMKGLLVSRRAFPSFGRGGAAGANMPAAVSWTPPPPVTTPVEQPIVGASSGGVVGGGSVEGTKSGGGA